MKLLSMIFCLLAAACACGQDFKPYDGSHVTVAQWESYRAQVVARFGDSHKEVIPGQLESFEDPATYTVYYFTLPANPAHPGWVTTSLAAGKGRIGYFAGDRDAFFRLLMVIDHGWRSATARANAHHDSDAPAGSSSTPAAAGPKEYCGGDQSVPPALPYMHWNCSGMDFASMAALKAKIRSGYVRSPASSESGELYEAEKPHYSAWVIAGQNAIRLSAQYQGDRYEGVGVTVFCFDTEARCAGVDRAAGSVAPDAVLMYKLGPPLAPPPPAAH